MAWHIRVNRRPVWVVQDLSVPCYMVKEWGFADAA
ncbi:MAG: hypothetical protein RL341_1840, partial [Pseudomonadota bacterium]